MRMLKGPVHPTGTAGVWEKECTAVQRSWRCLALNSIVSGHSWYSQGHTWLCHWWQSHGWAARIDSLGNSRQTIISPERSRQVCRWLLPFSSRSVTSAFPSWCEGGSGSVVSDSDCLVPWYSYESKNCSSAGGEGAWMTNKLLVLVLKVGNDKNNCVVLVFPIVSHQQETCLSDSAIWKVLQGIFTVLYNRCMSWTGKNCLLKLILSPVTLEWDCFRLSIELSGRAWAYFVLNEIYSTKLD